MKQAIIDTDTLSFFFRGNRKVVSKIDKYLIEYGFIHISIIVYIKNYNLWLFGSCVE
ncbi:MAG: hypothetical protein K9H64_19975 [Bacteroidales bacterium]|nr:hypothetical protein [Bacteroidales bacterium]MCF8458347.1 hypothetical protein [Bacteroidales bacterium]